MIDWIKNKLKANAQINHDAINAAVAASANQTNGEITKAVDFIEVNQDDFDVTFSV